MNTSIGARLQHVVAELSIQNLQRKAEKRLADQLQAVRPASFPFISADTFRSIADLIIEGEKVVLRQPRSLVKIIYFDISFLSGQGGSFATSPSLALLRSVTREQSSKPVLILHNGDIPPETSVLRELGKISAHVFASNLVESLPNVTALPVGLENAYRNVNGNLHDFLTELDHLDSSPRETMIFSSFNVGNNANIRAPLAELLRSTEFGWSDARLSPAEYRNRVRAAKFVISPPGNGVDCHRTWEAIYLGAVPVVLRGALSESLTYGTPIYSTESFEDFVRTPHAELDKIFREWRSRAADRCYMPFWVDEIRAHTHG